MILEFEGKTPVIHENAYIAETAVITGDVTVGDSASVWFGAVIRGDHSPIVLGDRANIQDNAVVHSDAGRVVRIGNGVTIGHGAIVHGCAIDDNVLVGMGAIIMNGAHIGANSIIGAGALVRENMEIPAGSVVVGSPARVVKELSAEQTASITANAEEYERLAAIYAGGK
ncbi:MAG: gamma carbonic anhydrase family protein [Oscillospiraceae bacterium]|nr:gamma carbonic anhydrase family protein [Oscillospiraceae bacterium]